VSATTIATTTANDFKRLDERPGGCGIRFHKLWTAPKSQWSQYIERPKKHFCYKLHNHSFIDFFQPYDILEPLGLWGRPELWRGETVIREARRGSCVDNGGGDAVW